MTHYEFLLAKRLSGELREWYQYGRTANRTMDDVLRIQSVPSRREPAGDCQSFWQRAQHYSARTGVYEYPASVNTLADRLCNAIETATRMNGLPMCVNYRTFAPSFSAAVFCSGVIPQPLGSPT